MRILIALLLTLALAPALTPHAAPALAALPAPPSSPTRAATPAADRFAVDVSTVVSPERAALLAAHGVQMVRYWLYWAGLQHGPTQPINWTVPDASLGALAAAGLDVQVLVTGNPGWAASHPDGPIDRTPIAVQYAFVGAAAARYGHAPYTVRRWEIYNEVDAAENWGHAAAAYAALVAADAALIHAAAPGAAVVLGGLGYDNFTDLGGGFVRSFLPDFLAAGGGASRGGAGLPPLPERARVAGPGDGAGGDPGGGGGGGGGPADPVVGDRGAERPGAREQRGGPGGVRGPGALGRADPGLATITWLPLQDFDIPSLYPFGSEGLLRLDGTAKPALTAYGVAAAQLADAVPVRIQAPGELDGNPAAEGDAYARADGGGLIVGWSPGTTATERLPANAVQSVVDDLGAPVAYGVVSGTAAIPLVAGPRYIALACPFRYLDVPCGAWFQPYVEPLSALGVVSGYADVTFRPYANTTRGQLSKMIVLALGWTVAPGQLQTFTDVPPGAPFYDVIATAALYGIISGYDCGGPGEPCDAQHRPYFRPNAAVTRGQLSKMVVLALGWTPVDPHGGPLDFVDVGYADPFYGTIEAAYQHGIVSGYADHTFRPGASATRAQLSKLIALAIGAP